MSRIRILPSLCLVVFSIVAGGCLVMSGKSIDESGVRISRVTLDQVVVGETTESWVVALLGEPNTTRVVNEDADIRILIYRHRVTRSEGGTVFLIFAGGSETTRTSTTYFEVTEGVVTRYWTEE